MSSRTSAICYTVDIQSSVAFKSTDFLFRENVGNTIKLTYPNAKSSVTLLFPTEISKR